MTVQRARNSKSRWWRSVALAAATCLPSVYVDSVFGQELTPVPPAVAPSEPTFGPPILPSEPLSEAPVAEFASSGPRQFTTQNYEAPSYAELEARVRELESRYQSDSAKFASLAKEMADGK